MKRNLRQVGVFLTGREIGFPASRDDLVKFAEGEQASSDVLELLRGYLK